MPIIAVPYETFWRLTIFPVDAVKHACSITKRYDDEQESITAYCIEALNPEWKRVLLEEVHIIGDSGPGSGRNATKRRKATGRTTSEG